ncbi:MAG: S8 family serine peptidase [Acidobacteriota bacterium]|nr:MAG: S8 family serine peptidase [Acidobacteriota bacterium]
MKLEKRRFCALVGTALCAALVFAGTALFGQEFPLGESPDLASHEPQPFGSYFVVLPSPPVLRRGFCIVAHSAMGGTTSEQERLAMELERDLVQGRAKAKIEWEANTKGPADEIFVKTKVKGRLNESQRARVDEIAASLEAGGEKARMKIEVKVAPVKKVLAARAAIGAEQLSVLAEIEALGKARFGAAFELPAPRRRYDSLINAVLLDLPVELVGPAKALPGVRDVQLNSEVTPQMDVSVPVTGAELAHAGNIKGCEKDKAGNCLKPVRVAVIDTGVDYTHPAFQVSSPPDPILDNIWTNPGELDEKGRITSGDVTPSSKAPDGCPGRCNVDDDKDGFTDLADPQVRVADYDNDAVSLYGANSKVDSTPGNCNDLDPINGDDDCEDILIAAADDDEDGFADNFHGVDLGDNDGDPRDDKAWKLSEYHGTHVASIIAGEGCSTSLTGMAPEAQIVAVKIFKSTVQEYPTFADVVDALGWVVNEVQPGAPDPRAEVANISLATECGHPQDMASVAVDSAVANGIVVVAPCGEHGNDVNIFSPGTARHAITVTPYTLQKSPDLPDDFWTVGMMSEGYVRYTDPAVPQEDRALFKPDLVAPGVHGSPARRCICAARTTLVDGFSGEDFCPQDLFPCSPPGEINYVFDRDCSSHSFPSIAAAHVSGAAALLLGEKPSWTPYFDAGQNQVANKVKDALVNRALLLPPPPFEECCPLFSIDCLRTCDAGFLAVGNGRLMVRHADDDITGALDTDFLVRPSTLSFGEVTTCDTGIVRTETLFVENLNAGLISTFTAVGTIEDCPHIPPPTPLGLAVTPVADGFEVEITQTGPFVYPEHCHGHKGVITVTAKDSFWNDVGTPIRVPWFLAVRDSLHRGNLQCRWCGSPLRFITPIPGYFLDGQLPVSIGTCAPGGEVWRVSTCGFSADTKVCFGYDPDNEECVGKAVSAIPGSFCPTGGNTGAIIDVVVPDCDPLWGCTLGVPMNIAIYDGCTSFPLGTLAYTDDVPGASFTHDAPGKCVGDEVQFTDTSTNFPRTWKWDFGDGHLSFEQNPVHIFEAGTYEVKLTVMNPCGSYDSFSDTLTMGASFTHDAPKCIGAPTVQFTNISAGSPTSFLWDFGDGDTSTEQSPTHTYPAEAKTYTVTLTVSGDQTCPAPTTFSDTVRIAGPPTISSASPPFGTTLGGTEVTVEGADMFDSLNPSVTLTGPSGSYTVTATGSSNGTRLTFVTLSLDTLELPPGTYSVEVITDCGESNALAFQHANLGFSAQEGASFGSIEIVDVDNNVSLDTLTLTSFVFTPREIAVTRAIGPAVEPQLYVLDSTVAGIPFLILKPLGNPEAIAMDRSFFFDPVDEIPNALAPDPVDAGLVYATSITKLSDPTQPAGVRVLDVSDPYNIVSDPLLSDRIENDLIEVHNCIGDGTGNCLKHPATPQSKVFAADIEVIAVNPTGFGIPFKAGDSVTVVANPSAGCAGTFSKDDLTQRYGYATSAAGEDSGTGVEGRSRLSILDLNPCAIQDISGTDITLVSNSMYQTEVEVFGNPEPGAEVPGPDEHVGLTLAKNDEGAFIYVLNKEANGPQVVIKIDAVARDFAYAKKDFPNVPSIVDVQDVVVAQRNAAGTATLIAAVSGANGTLHFFQESGVEVDTDGNPANGVTPVCLAAAFGGDPCPDATIQPDDIAVHPDGQLLYVSFAGAVQAKRFIAEVDITDFTKAPRLLSDSGGGIPFTGTLKGIAFDSVGDLYVCEQDFNLALDDRVRKFTVPGAGNQLGFTGIETTNVDDPVDAAVDEGDGVVAVLDFGGAGDPPGQLKLFTLDLSTVQGALNSLHDPRDVVTEEPGVYAVAEQGKAGFPQTGDVRLFKTQSGSKKVIRGQFGASGVDILGDHTDLTACLGSACSGKRYVVSDYDLEKVFQLEKPVILDTGLFPNDAVTVGEGAQQQVWVCSGEPGDTTSGTTNRIDVFITSEDVEVPDPKAPIDLTASPPVGGNAFAPTSMAAAEFPSGEKRIFVTMFDSDKILVYDGTPGSATQYQLHPLPPSAGIIPVGAGPRRIVIQPEIVE